MISNGGCVLFLKVWSRYCMRTGNWGWSRSVGFGVMLRSQCRVYCNLQSELCWDSHHPTGASHVGVTRHLYLFIENRFFSLPIHLKHGSPSLHTSQLPTDSTSPLAQIHFPSASLQRRAGLQEDKARHNKTRQNPSYVGWIKHVIKIRVPRACPPQ